jgi:hypothetical protein
MGQSAYSSRSTIAPLHAAALFGAALTKTGDVNITLFATGTERVKFPKGGSVLSAMEAMLSQRGRIGLGTNIPDALRTWNGEDRIIILTDMQSTRYDHGLSVRPDNVPVYAFNLNAYETTIVDPAKKMYEFGGLTDNTFQMINALEAGAQARWPWDSK